MSAPSLPCRARLIQSNTFLGDAGTIVTVTPYAGNAFSPVGPDGADCHGDFWSGDACIGAPRVHFEWLPSEPRIAIEIRGGLVVAVRASEPVRVDVVDWDDIDASEDRDEDTQSAETLLAGLPVEVEL